MQLITDSPLEKEDMAMNSGQNVNSRNLFTSHGHLSPLCQSRSTVKYVITPHTPKTSNYKFFLLCNI